MQIFQRYPLNRSRANGGRGPFICSEKLILPAKAGPPSSPSNLRILIHEAQNVLYTRFQPAGIKDHSYRNCATMGCKRMSIN